MSPPPLLPRLIVGVVLGALFGGIAGWISGRSWIGVGVGIAAFVISFLLTVSSPREPGGRLPRMPAAQIGGVAVFFEFRSLGYAILSVESRERILVAGLRRGEQGAVFGLECDVVQDGRVVASRTWEGETVETELAAPLSDLDATVAAASFKPSDWLRDVPRPCVLKFRWDPGRLATRAEHWRPPRIDLGEVKVF